MPFAEDVHIGESVVRGHIDKAVQEILSPAESLLGAFHGQALSEGGYGGQARQKGGSELHHYMLVTDSRVIFWSRGLIKGSTDSFRYEDIASVEEARGFLLGEIVLNIRGARERFRSMPKKDVPIAAEMIRAKVSLQRNHSAGVTSSQSPEFDSRQDKKAVSAAGRWDFERRGVPGQGSELLSQL